jgi:outer membrane protein assembly factor BamA
MNQRIVLLLLLFGITLSSYAQKDKNVEWAAIPAPSYNEVQGFGLTVTAGLFYDLSKKDTVSTPSSTFVYGFYAENESWVGAIFHQSYLNENRNWFDVLYAGGNLNFQIYQQNPFKDGQNFAIDYSTRFQFLKLNYLRKVKGGIYAGLHYKLSNFNTEFDFGLPDSLLLPKFSTDAFYSGPGIKLAYDTRDYKLNPRKGIHANVITQHFNTAFGSDANFNTVEAEYNQYVPINTAQVIAARFYSFFSFGEVAFEEQPILGRAGPRGNDVRGYSTGRYRGDQLYDLQAEWRWRFHKRFGMVAFGSMSLIGNNKDQISSNGMLPALGAGIRFMAAQEKNVNIGVDVAFGKEDYGVYFAISEAF